jgi:hypothetical protein
MEQIPATIGSNEQAPAPVFAILGYNVDREQTYIPVPGADPDKQYVAVDLETLLRLQADANQYQHDIEFTVKQLFTLLTDLGLINKQGQFEFRMSSLTKNLQVVLFQSSKAQNKFKYLAALADIITRYAPLVAK